MAKALQHEIQDDIKKFWQLIIEDTEFLNKMVQAVRIRQGMEPSQLEAHIAYSAGESRQSKVMTGARAVIDILLESGLLKESDGQIVASEIGNDLRSEHEQETEQEPEHETTKTVSLERSTTSPQHPISISLSIQIDASPDELEGLASKINSFLKEVNEFDPEIETSQE